METPLAVHEPESIRVVFQLERADVERSFHGVARETRHTYAKSLLKWLLYTAVMLAVSMLAAQTARNVIAPQLLIFVGLAGGYSAISYFRSTWSLEKHWAASEIEQNPAQLLPTTVEITPEGVFTESELSRTFRSWVMLKEVSPDDAFVYLMSFSEQSLHIPHRTFKNDAAREQFITVAEKWRVKAHEAYERSSLAARE